MGRIFVEGGGRGREELSEDEEDGYEERGGVGYSWGSSVRCGGKIDGRWGGPLTKEGRWRPFRWRVIRRRETTCRRRSSGGEE